MPNTPITSSTFGDANLNLILLDGEPVGRLYLYHRKDEIRIIDLALLTEHRSQGIGSALLRDILDQATQAELPVRFHVERNNPALALYHRPGFCEIGDEGVYCLMEWEPRKVRLLGAYCALYTKDRIRIGKKTILRLYDD